MSPIARALTTLTVLILFVASPFSSVMAQVRPPLPPGLKGKDLEKLRRQVNNNNDRRKQEYEKKKKEEEERYHVVQIGLTFEVVQKKNFGSVKKGAPKKYKDQVSAYKKERDEAKKSGEKFKGLKPPSTVFKVLTKKGFKSQKEAKTYADKLQKKIDSKRKK